MRGALGLVQDMGGDAYVGVEVQVKTDAVAAVCGSELHQAIGPLAEHVGVGAVGVVRGEELLGFAEAGEDAPGFRLEILSVRAEGAQDVPGRIGHGHRCSKVAGQVAVDEGLADQAPSLFGRATCLGQSPQDFAAGRRRPGRVQEDGYGATDPGTGDAPA
jgi:hypothetical protein